MGAFIVGTVVGFALALGIITIVAIVVYNAEDPL